MNNIQTAQAIYAAFGRGDAPWILDRLTDDVRWEHWEDIGNSAQDAGVPVLAQRSGKDDVAAFFGGLSGLEFHRFQPYAFYEGDGGVIARIDVDIEVKETGRRWRDDELHLWEFDDDGLVCGLRHYIDTAKVIAGWDVSITPPSDARTASTAPPASASG